MQPKVIASSSFPALFLTLLCAVNAFAGPTGQVIYNFADGIGGTQFPLALDKAGNLYGTAPDGGTAGSGVVFELSRTSGGDWRESTLYSFSENNRPQSGVIFDTQGNLYGETQDAEIYELTPNTGGAWTETTLWTFTGDSGGSDPYGGLTFDRDGNLYGAAKTSGDLKCNVGGVGCGLIFKLTHNSSGQWTEHVLYTFQNPSNGAQPWGPLVFDANGNLYGTTYYGGDTSCYDGFLAGCGVVFELSHGSSGSWVENVLFTFTQQPYTLAHPISGVILDTNGNLYGVASGGGDAFGAVYEMSPAANGIWTETTLYSFKGGAGDGAFANNGLIVADNGDILGTTAAGGGPDDGVIFQLLPASGGGWSERLLHTFFLTKYDGASPRAGLTIGSNGTFFGTTAQGGANGTGIVYQFTR